jgi:acetate CoA/acetoacetate CoA-transferase beta subunit
MDAKHIIAKRIAQELKDGDVVNLGIGIPTLVADYIEEGLSVYMQGENGIIGLGGLAKEGEVNNYLTNPSGAHATITKHAAYIDSSLSFMIIRGGHIDYTVLGALEVDQEGSLASWIIPGKLVPGMGGSMDLVTGAKNVIIATTHQTAKGESKIKKVCTLPLTAYKKVNLIVTELAVFQVKADGLHLIERHKDVSIEEIVSKTDADLIINHVGIMEV